MDTIDMETTVSHRPDILTSAFEDELVMVNLERGYYYGIERVGTIIWGLLSEPQKVADLVDSLEKIFKNMDRDTCERETLAFLNDLFQEDLLVRHES